MSNQHLLSAFIILFLSDLVATNQLNDWRSAAKKAICAELLWVLVAASGILFASVIHGGEHHATRASFRASVWLSSVLAATLTWYSMMRICMIHSLEIRCFFPRYCQSSAADGNVSVPDLDGVKGFLLSWAWLPAGLLRSVGGVLCRPWHFLITIVVREKLRMPWWQWREVLVGVAFWCSTLFCIKVVRRINDDMGMDSEPRRFFIAIGTLFCHSLTLGVVALTADPCVTCWCFAGRLWAKTLLAVLRKEVPALRVNEWLSLVVMCWLFVRLVYLLVMTRVAHWTARQKVDEGLRVSLAHPFVADLEEGFAHVAASDSLQRTTSNMSCLSSASLLTLPCLVSLKEKQQVLIDLSRAVGEQNLLQSWVFSLRVSRTRILQESQIALLGRPLWALLAPRIQVSYEGEAGLDAGGLARDWFDCMAHALARDSDDSTGTSLFIATADGTLLPRPVCDETPETGSYESLMAAGRFLALAVLHKQPVPLSLSMTLCKHLLQEPVNTDDVRRLDPEFYRWRVLQVLRDGGLADSAAALGEPLTFMSAPTERQPVPEELVPGGAQLRVTEENKLEYIQRLCEAFCCGGIRRELQCLMRGFWDLLPPDVCHRASVTPRELSVFLSGVQWLDPEEWRRQSESGHSQVSEWFWQVVQELNPEQGCMLLHFTTGSSRLPLGGFAELQPRFSVSVDHSRSEDHLPYAHTCTNGLVLFRYSSKDLLREKLLQALSARGFGFA